MKSKHMWWMVVGCVAMFVGIYFVSLGQLSGLGLLLLLACPLMHLFMMKGMHGENHTHAERDSKGKTEI